MALDVEPAGQATVEMPSEGDAASKGGAESPVAAYGRALRSKLPGLPYPSLDDEEYVVDWAR